MESGYDSESDRNMTFKPQTSTASKQLQIDQHLDEDENDDDDEDENDDTDYRSSCIQHSQHLM